MPVRELPHCTAAGGNVVNKKDIRILARLFEKMSRADTEDALAAVIEETMPFLGDKDVSEMKTALYKLGGRMLLIDKENRDAVRARRIACLTDEEKAELQKVEEIIDNNLLKYYFQPIVTAWDGEIYSYEALMRSAADPDITPNEIIKYAAINDRLADIERLTFMNVLEIVARERENLGGRAVFINSIPDVKLDEADFTYINEMLKQNADITVVELTESTEADDAQLDVLKDRYSSMDIKIAVDDYGTGYSNVRNLLRYTPNFVKIDRSLLSAINNNPKKRHFVREIIEFCHDNRILALAEGVENEMELKTVILMGVDLIQGFYTARPAPELITSIPYKIKQEIRRYSLERVDGKETHVYTVRGTERVSLDKLKRHGYKCVRVACCDEDEKCEVTIVGSPSLDSRIHIEVDSGFHGKIALESAHLSNTKLRPSIILGEDCVVELFIFGECMLHKGGIYVPESSEITFTGAGVLAIDVDDNYFFGIGSYHNMRHGKLTFLANVEYIISAYGDVGVAIGSHLGGKIDIQQGIFKIKLNCSQGVCIGTLEGDTTLDISNCGIETSMTTSKGAIIGSVNGNAKVDLQGMSFKTALSGKQTTCIGSVDGKSSVLVQNSNFISDVRSDAMTVLGSLNNDSEVTLKSMHMEVSAGGQDAYVFCGAKGKASLTCGSVDIVIELSTARGGLTLAAGDKFSLTEGRYMITVNGEQMKFG